MATTLGQRPVHGVLLGPGAQHRRGLREESLVEVNQGTLLHYDSEYDLIAKVTGQPTEWVVPRGCAD